MTASLDLQFERGRRGGSEILAVTGDVDAHTAPQLREALDAVLADDARKIVVDLGNVDLLDSTGLGVILGTVSRLRGVGGTLRVACPHSHVRRVFEITGVTDFVGVDLTLDEAIAAMP